MAFDSNRHHQIEQFLYHEAYLADENRLDDWFALWDDQEDVIYWVPCNKDDVDPMREVSIIYDNYHRLNLRMERTKSGLAWTQEPRSRLRRLLSNIQTEEMEKGKVRAFANFHITELRENSRETTEWIGRTEYHLKPAGTSFRICFKKILLINNDMEISQLSFLI